MRDLAAPQDLVDRAEVSASVLALRPGATTPESPAAAGSWRQTTRTQLTEGTTAALFVLDAPGPLPVNALAAAADDLLSHLSRLGRDVRAAQRLVGPS